MTQERQLAAIMFTDIVGYTKIMGQDEALAHEYLAINRAIQIPIIEEYSGRFLKEMGDGIMASFESASNAVLCALAIQKHTSKQDKFQLKIGIHIDDVVLTDNDAFGNGVNIAARIEAMAKPDTIVISEAAHQMVKNLTGINTRFIKEARFKNVESAVKLYQVFDPQYPISHSEKTGIKKRLLSQKTLAITVMVLLISTLTTYFFLPKRISESYLPGADPAGFSSIAVLPFVDLSQEGDQEYLGDGLAEEILNVLADMEDLKVISRTSSFSFKNKNMDIREMGNQLNAETILEGSVRKSNDMIRITAQLIETENGSHLWSETYDRTFEDLFAIQDEISQQIADKLQITIIFSKERSAPTEDIDAYDQYLKGRYAILRGVEGAKEAKNYFEAAINFDPEFAEAYAQLANAYWHIGYYQLENGDKAVTKAKAAANSATKIGPDSYSGYSILSFINLTIDWDWQASLENHKLAIERGLPVPDPKHAYYKIALYPNPMDAVNDIEELLALDPLSIGRMLELSRINLWARRYQEVINNGIKTLSVSPQNASILRHMGDAYLFSGQTDLAYGLYNDWVIRDSTFASQSYIATLAELDKFQEARNYYDMVNNSMSSTQKAQALFHLNELDSGFYYLNMALEQRDPNMLFLKVEPHYDTVRDDPRFIEVLTKMNFPIIDDES